MKTPNETSVIKEVQDGDFSYTISQNGMFSGMPWYRTDSKGRLQVCQFEFKVRDHKNNKVASFYLTYKQAAILRKKKSDALLIYGRRVVETRKDADWM